MSENQNHLGIFLNIHLSGKQNKIRSTDTWNRLIDLREEVGGVGLEEIRQGTYVHICKVHGHRRQRGEGWDGGGA